MKNRLARLTTDVLLMSRVASESKPDFSRMPQAGSALYVPPAPGYTRRLCNNCCLWIDSGECDVHAPGLEVAPDAVCGYWVGGTPLTERSDRKVLHVLPEFSGLERVPGGTHCGNCKWFKKGSGGKGLCQAVANKERDGFQEVHKDGCCALWEG